MGNDKNINLYEVRKTVRFELKPYIKTRETLKWEDSYSQLDSYIKHIKEDEFEENFNWNQFCVNKYDDFLEKSKKIYEFLKEINTEIKKEHYDETKKSIQFDFKKSKGIFKNIPSLKKVQWFESLKEKLSEIENEYKNLIDFFDKIKTNKENPNEKKSEISKYLRKFSYVNRSFLTIFSLLWQNQWEETDEEILENFEKLKNSLWESFEKLNNSIIASHENETTWACIWKFSFNKYSLFRRETETLKEKYENYKQQNKKLVEKLVENEDIKDDKWEKVDIKLETILNLQLEKDKLEQENSILQWTLKNFNFNRNLDEVISELDLINWQLLNNYIQRFKEKYKLDKNIINVEFVTYQKDWERKYNYQKWKLKKLYDENYNFDIKLLKWQKLIWYKYLYLINKENISWIEKENRKLAHKFLKIIFKLQNINKDYNTIKKLRDKLAKYRWKIRQDLKASEREFINEAMIRHYAKVLEKDWNYFLALTPKEKISWKDLKNIEIEKYIKESISDDKFKVYNYSHLNFQSLEKLCLMKDWSLLPNENLIKQWNSYKNQKNDISINIITFKTHIKNSLIKLKENNWEDWTIFNSEIEKLWTIEEIVNFVNKNFYKFIKQEIFTEKVFELAQNWEIELYQIYSKDFNIFNENFLSNEDEYLKVLETWLEHSEITKLISKTKREKEKEENLFTIYFKELFLKTDTFLWQEWWIFFRKWDETKEHKRFRSNKFFVNFDLLFNKWEQNHKTKLCEKKEKITEEHIKQINEFTKSKIKNISLENLILVWIDRWEKEHITYWVYNWNLEFQWIIWNTNYIKKVWVDNEKFEIINDWNFTLSNDLENKNKIYKQLETTTNYYTESWNEEFWNLMQLNWLQKYQIERIFQLWKNWEYFTHLQNWWKFILNNKNYWFTILDKGWNEIKIVDKKDNKEVIDYYLLFQAEYFKRVLEIDDQIKYSQNMYNLKKWYISVIKDFLKEIILKYKKEWKEVVLIVEDLSSKKIIFQEKGQSEISNKYLWATILSDIEEQIINEFNYLIFKEKENNYKLQLTPNIRKKDILTDNKFCYKYLWNCIFINKDNTSTWCPVCKEKFIETEKKIIKWKEIKNIKEVHWNTLYWHWTWNNEWNMKHLTNEEYDYLYNNDKKFKKDNSSKNWDKKENKYLSWVINWKICDFYLQNPKYPHFNFIKSWDDLATYNIAKKWLEFLTK